METRRIKARNGEGLAFSVVGQGTGPLGDFYELLDEKTSIATVEQALASGIAVFDTSPHYGNGLAEAGWARACGARRATRSSSRPRSAASWIRFTKPPKPRSDVVSPGFAGGYPACAALRLFLRRRDALGRAFVAAHGARPARHRADPRLRRLDAWPGGSAGALQGGDGRRLSALDKLRSEKVVKAIGFGINEADTCVKFAKAGDFDVAMMAGPLHADRPDRPDEFLPLALEKKMGVMLAGVFNSGILATGSGARRQVRLRGRAGGGRRRR